MSDRFSRGVERAMQEAEARGEFQNLPGAGKPLPGIGEPLQEDWWLRQRSTRENIGEDALPKTMRLRKDLAELPDRLDALSGEPAVREALEAFNERVRQALIGPPDGPPLNFGPVDIESEVAGWRRRRSA